MATGKRKTAPKKKVTPKKKDGVKKQTSTRLVWKKQANGWDSASYKLGIIYRYKGKYSCKTHPKSYYSVGSLARAKKIIDDYTAQIKGK